MDKKKLRRLKSEAKVCLSMYLLVLFSAVMHCPVQCCHDDPSQEEEGGAAE